MDHSSTPWRRADDGARAARAVARELGLEEPQLVAVRGAALWRAGEVALRVERPATDARQMLRLVELAIAAGVPAVPPLRAEPIEHRGEQVTLWRWVERATDREPDTACLGTALRLLHDHVLPSAWEQAGAPPLLVQFERRMARNLNELEGTDFNPDLTRLLREQVSIWVARAADGLDTPLGSVALHGDAHPGNLITTTAGCQLADWELACVGPGEWDHGHLLMHIRRGLTDPDRYDAFAAGYGIDIRGSTSAEPWIRLHELLATARMAARSLREPALRGEARTRIGWWL
jgi:aminoglycoside phosphotransferase (APT) family kinase protein